MARSKLNLGVIGAGGIAHRRTIPGMLAAKHCCLVAVMDVVGVDQLAAEYQVRGYASEAELLADPEVQAVYIASPVDCHLHQIELAAQAGKHILCEKPLAMNFQQTQQAVEICRRREVFLQEGYMMKFHGAHRKIKELIDQGCLGKIVSMRAQLSCWYPPIAGAWRQDPERGGGGALIDMATHLYDLLEYFAGPVRHVAALVGNLAHDYPSDDASTTLLEFMSGAQATVDCLYCIPDDASRTRLEIYGLQGALLSEGTIGQTSGGKLEGIFGLGTAGYDATQGKEVLRNFQRIPFKHVNPYTAECEYFAHCVLQGCAPQLNNDANALRIATIAKQAYRSCRAKEILPV